MYSQVYLQVLLGYVADIQVKVDAHGRQDTGDQHRETRVDI